MKCKRCFTQVPDEMDLCPNCGQDLSSLRELLKNFYAEEPIQSSDQIVSPSRSELPRPSRKKRGSGKVEPRIVWGSEKTENSPEFKLAEALPSKEPLEEEGEVFTWERSLRGGFWLRSLAFMVDYLILLFTLAIFTILGFLAAELGGGGGREIFLLQQARIVLPILLPLAIVLILTYFTFFHGTWGQTIGKMIFRLRVLRTDGQPLSFSRALGRTLAYILSGIPFFLGFFWVGFTRSKRSWHDAIAGTMVIREQ